MINRELFQSHSNLLKHGAAEPDQLAQLIVHLRWADQFGNTNHIYAAIAEKLKCERCRGQAAEPPIVGLSRSHEG